MDMERLYQQLKIDEGCVDKIYLDHLGYKTFGIGHKVTMEDPEWTDPVGTPVSEDRIYECFEFDIEDAIDNCFVLFGDQFDYWPDEVQEILANMIFNLGLTGLSKFKKFRAALNNEDWKQAAVEGRDSLWYKQVKNRAERLMFRLENV
jgi:GH24 family phage-related lysozyme (muramidase)